jgi:hypothetical protein
MNSPVVNSVSFLRRSREFPKDGDKLLQTLDKSYIEIANAVNDRIIGVYATNKPTITGESWFFTSLREQTLRQIYKITSTSALAHGIALAQVAGITSMYGQWTDGTNWYGFIAGSSVSIAGQISFYLSPTQIVFLTGAGAPTFKNGIIVLEWLSQV